MKKLNNVFSVAVFLLLSMSGLSCKTKTPLQIKYGNDADYFMALKAIEDGKKDEGTKLLAKASKKFSPIIKKEALITLSENESSETKIQHLLSAYALYKDEETLDYLCRAFIENRQFDKVIEYTEGLNLATDSNILIEDRLKALYNTDRPKFDEDFSSWCLARPFAQEHAEECKYIEDKGYGTLPLLIDFRLKVFNKDYRAAYEMVSAIEEGEYIVLPEITKDMGRTLMYASSNYTANAKRLQAIEEKKPLPTALFYSNFYQGRLYEKSGANKEAVKYFLEAMKYAPDNDAYDNALWYYLNTTLKYSLNDALAVMEEYSPKWHDRNYFDDILESISVKLMAEHRWADYYRTCSIIKDTASREAAAKYSYITARLIDSSLIDQKIYGQETPENLTDELYHRALNSGTEPYYRILACYRLNEDLKASYQNQDNFDIKTDFIPNADEELLLSGYIDFGLTDRVFDQYMKHYDEISLETSEKAASYLRLCADNDAKHDYYVQSLRIASKKALQIEKPMDEAFLKVLYPIDYSTIVKENCSNSCVNEYLLYGLMRTESFFDADIQSHAGASGLTQLMDSTAQDIARKLKISDYDLTEPEINIKFGTFYLDELIRRLEGSEILAIFSYNGGISRVRSWYRTAQKEYGMSEVPKDLFLEAVPITETRDYGRKVLSAAVMYGILYYDKVSHDIVHEILE